MSTTFNLYTALRLLVLVCVVSAAALQADTYTVDLRNASCWSGGHIVYQADHGMSGRFALTVYDGVGGSTAYGDRVAMANYSASINTSSGNLTFTPGAGAFPNGFCGVLVLRGGFGAFGAADTSDADDFKLENGSGGSATLIVIAQNGYSRRSVGGHVYAADIAPQASAGSSCSGDVHVYFDAAGGRLTFASSAAGGATCLSVTDAAAVAGSSFPSGSVPIGIAHQSGTNFSVTSDDRPW